MKRSIQTLLACCAGTIAALAALGTGAVAPSIAATPPPTPPPINAATPIPAATDAPGSSSSSAPIPLPSGVPSLSPAGGATPTPPPEGRKGIDGVWEVQIQNGDKTDYTHFKVLQTGQTLQGSYMDNRGKQFPLAGSIDGKNVRLIVSMNDGTTLLLQGRLDGTTDMVGLLTTPQGDVPFTAAYRAKVKWIDNVSPAPGGLGAGTGNGGVGGGGAPGTNGGYVPPR